MDRKIKSPTTEQEHLINQKSTAIIQSKRLENYSNEIKEALESYAEEIDASILPYNRTSSGKTMALRLVRTSTQKTQNRKTHQEMVEMLAVECAKRLGLNEEAVRVMAKYHDVGHTLFGHGGEWWLSDIKREIGLGVYTHNALGAKELIYRHRIYDEIIDRIKEFHPEVTETELKRIRKSLWLIFDAINSHNGELSENEFKPNSEKTEKDFEEEIMRCHIEDGFDRTIMLNQNV